MKTKVCTKCHLEKSLENDFSKHPHTLDGRSSWCRACFREWHTKYEYERRHNPETRTLVLVKDKRSNQKRTSLDHRRNNLKKQYGLSLSQWEQLFEKQGRKCSACGNLEPSGKKGWATDHDHETGKIRGILCQPCNMALGLLQDSIGRLEKLMAYLKTNKPISIEENILTISPTFVMKAVA